MADVVVPEVDIECLAVFISPTSVQEDPFHCSLIAVDGGLPPTAKAALYTPILPLLPKELFISAAVDHAPTGLPAPTHSSVAVWREPGGVSPPKFNPLIAVPVPAIQNLAVDKLFCSAKDVPFHNSA